MNWIAPALTHADYSRSRLLRLLDDLDRIPPDPQRVTLAVPARQTLPLGALPPESPHLNAVIEHAERSETGAFIYLGPDVTYVVSPPYPVVAAFHAVGYEIQPLRALINTRPRIAVVLLRFGGYAIGVYEGDRLVESRNDSRFVKNRHRKGGQSQRRFDRIREKQVHELFAHLCEDAAQRLAPHAGTLDWLAYGGDTHTVQSFLKECRFLREFPCRVLPRFLTVPEPRHETLERLPALLSGSRVTTAGG